MSPHLIAVAVPVPFLDLLTYRVPSSIKVPPVGARVRVPLGSRTVTGCVVSSEGVPAPTVELRDLIAVLDSTPFLPTTVVGLCQWVADYYMTGIGDVISVAMPPGAKKRISSYKLQPITTATVDGLAIVRNTENLDSRGLGQKQIAALQLLSENPSGMSSAALRQKSIGGDVVNRLVRRGLATVRKEHENRDPFQGTESTYDVQPNKVQTLTKEQIAVLASCQELADLKSFRVALLHGVTGSGKTEVYLRLAEHVQKSGRQVLLMVPEIALTSGIAAQFRSVFGERVAIQHSGLSDGERHDQWQQIRHGKADIVVGTRSSVFCPLSKLGLIIVDEEHDNSYKQEESPRYHGRDVAILRGSREQALVLLGSATPSMESYQHCITGKYVHLRLDRRVLGRPLADVHIVNMRDEMAKQGPDVVVSRDLEQGIRDRLERSEQVLVLLNRRGYSAVVFCRQCGDAFECPNCSISLTVHRARVGNWRARCHYCDYSITVPKQCRRCAAPYLEQAGFGTERVEQEIVSIFPEARVARIDSDTIRRRGVLTERLTSFARGDLDIIVGTQMIAKGHDYPRVTLVGVISADVGLGLADFRASERVFQLLTQVAGRAGRGERMGETIVQTLYPDHYSIALARQQDYAAFFKHEVVFRRGMHYPPFYALINIIVRGRTLSASFETAKTIAQKLSLVSTDGKFSVLGPAPAPIVRLRGEHRVQLFLKGTHRTLMRKALERVLAGMPKVRKRITVDVDPVSVL